MKYYIGKEFDTEENREYKTLEGAKKAAEKAGLNVYDEEGVQVYPLAVELTDDVPDGAMEENPDGSINAYDDEGQAAGTVAPEDVESAEKELTEEDVDKALAATRTEEEVHGKVRMLFRGKLRLRKRPSFEKDAVCGVTSFMEKEVVKRAVVDGKIMYKTISGHWISGDPKHVEFVEEK